MYFTRKEFLSDYGVPQQRYYLETTLTYPPVLPAEEMCSWVQKMQTNATSELSQDKPHLE